MATTIPTARANLLTLLQAAYSATVQCTFGPPRFEDAQVVAIMGVKDVETDFAQVGSATPGQQEVYDLEVAIKHLDRGAQHADLAAVDLAAWALYSTLVETVQANTNLSGALTDGWAIVSAVEGGSGPVPAFVGDPDAEPDDPGAGDTQGFVEFIPCRVRCQARI